MRDYFDSNTGRYGTQGIAPALAAAIPAAIGAIGSIGGGMLAGKAQKKAEKRAIEQAGRDTVNAITTAELDRRQAQAAAERAAFLPGSRFQAGGVTAEGGFQLGDEFLTEAQARQRGLIRDTTETIMQDIAQSGQNAYVDREIKGIFVDPRLQRTQRTRLAPELEAMRSQALDFQRAAGAQLVGGAGAATQRELDLLQQLAAPREAEAREQIFGQLQRAGILQSTGGVNFARGQEEALARAGLERELAAIRSGREGQRLASDIFQLGSSTVGGLSAMEREAAASQLGLSQAARGQAAPFIQSPTNVFAGTPSRGASPYDVGMGAALASFGQQIAGADFSKLFPGVGGTPQGAATGTTPNRSEVLFGTYAR